MKAIVIHQPWAWAIVNGHKRAENRTWQTPYRGPLAIVAGKSRESMSVGLSRCAELSIDAPSEFQYGAIIGVVDLIAITDADGIDCPFATGPFCWHLANPRAVHPVPFAGRLSIFDLDPTIASAISMSAAGPQ